MAGTDVPPPVPPAHVAGTIRSITRLHAEHHQNATPETSSLPYVSQPRRKGHSE